VGPLLTKVEEDRDTPKHLADRIGSGSNLVKEFTVWVSENASRTKLGAGLADEFGEFGALEFLALGIPGKLSLWFALQVLAPADDRLRGVDFERLIVTRCEERLVRPAFASHAGQREVVCIKQNTKLSGRTIPIRFDASRVPDQKGIYV
jgi:hypothetical protein